MSKPKWILFFLVWLVDYFLEISTVQLLGGVSHYHSLSGQEFFTFFRLHPHHLCLYSTCPFKHCITEEIYYYDVGIQCIFVVNLISSALELCGLKTNSVIAWFCVFQIICSNENHLRIQKGNQVNISNTVHPMCVPHLGIFRGITLRQVETLKTKVGEKNMLKTISGVFKYTIFFLFYLSTLDSE